MPSNLIAVKHNIEVAHRLFELKGNKCENIHGHSMWIKLELRGNLDEHGLLEGIDFGTLKAAFRGHLDNTYDHRLLLNQKDPWATSHAPLDLTRVSGGAVYTPLPGLQRVPGDPTTENLAEWIGMYMKKLYDNVSACEVWETSVNMARWEV